MHAGQGASGPPPAAATAPADAGAASGASKAALASWKPAVSAASAAQMQQFDPMLARNMQQLLLLLSVFSFGP